LGLEVEVAGQRRQEDGVRPAPLDVQQVAGGDVVGRVDRAADQRLGRLQVAAAPGGEPGVQERVDRVAAAAAGPVVVGRAGAAGQAGGAVVDPAQHGPAAVVH